MLEKCKRYGYCSFTIQKLIKIMFLYPRSKGHIHFILVFLFVCPPVCLFITIILQRFLNYFKLHVLEILPHSFVYVSHMMGLFFVQKNVHSLWKKDVVISSFTFQKKSSQISLHQFYRICLKC